MSVPRLFTLAMFCAVLFGIPAATRSIEYGGIGGKPANPRPEEPRSDSIFIHTINPGSSADDAVLVINNSDEKKELVVYSADSTPSTDGGFACKQYVEKKQDVGKWIALDETVELDAHSTIEIPFTIQVPKKTEVGEYNGCILIQEKEDSDTDNAQGATVSFRTGLRVAVTLPGDIIHELSIRSLELSTPDIGKLMLHPVVENTGNASLNAHVQIDVHDMFGRTIGNAGGEFAVLREEESAWNFSVNIPEYGGLYTVDMHISYIGGDESPDQDIVTLDYPSQQIWIWPPQNLIYTIVAIGGAIVLLCVMLYVIRRKKRRKKKKRSRSQSSKKSKQKNDDATQQETE